MPWAARIGAMRVHVKFMVVNVDPTPCVTITWIAIVQHLIDVMRFNVTPMGRQSTLGERACCESHAQRHYMVMTYRSSGPNI